MRQRPDPCTPTDVLFRPTLFWDAMQYHHSSPLCLAIRLTLSWNATSVTSSLPFASSMDPLPGQTLMRALELLHALPSPPLRPSAPRSGRLEHDTMSMFPSPSPCPRMRRYVASLCTSLWDATSCCVPCASYWNAT